MVRDYLANKPYPAELLKDAIEAAVSYHFSRSTDNQRQANTLLNNWQERNREEKDSQGKKRNWVDCLVLLPEAVVALYEEVFRLPDIDLALLPPYSFVIQFTFTLAQPYISHDEQDFYIIDNPIRKDKIFRLPYVASTSWKGSLRAAFWQMSYKGKDERVRRLFGNEKDEGDKKTGDDVAAFQAGRLYFYPTFFTVKSLEIINPQDRKLRSGKLPIPFESVPHGAEGVFTLLYVPFDVIGDEREGIRQQVAEDIKLVAQGLIEMFRTSGFGAKTSSGFGLANESLKEVRLEIRAAEISKDLELPSDFDELVKMAERLGGELEHGATGK